jgi:hypothetical protein
MARFIDYALEQMAVRGIDRDDVENVLADPEDEEFSREPPYRYLYWRQIGGRRLLVVVEPDDRDCVVNAFWPPPPKRRRK